MTPRGSQELEPTCWLPPSGEPASPWDPKGHPQCPLPLIIIRTKCAQLLTKYFTRIIRYDSHSNPAWSVGWLFAIYKWGNWGPEKFGGSGVVMATEWWGWDLSPGLVTLSLSWSVNSPFHHFSTYSSLSLFLFPFPSTNLRNSDDRNWVFFLFRFIKIHHILSFLPSPIHTGSPDIGKDCYRMKMLRITTLWHCGPVALQVIIKLPRKGCVNAYYPGVSKAPLLIFISIKLFIFKPLLCRSSRLIL